MKNLHIIATDKPSRLYFVKDKLKLSPLKFTNDKEVDWLTHNLYITSDEEIKEGDWVLNEKSNSIYPIFILFGVGFYEKKIILTTNQDLIEEGVQSIDDEFLEWLVKNPSCEEVDIIEDTFTVKEVSMLPLGTRNLKYKIIIPKQELSKLIDEIDREFINKAFKSKQKTIEETAERILANNIDGLRDALKDDDLFYFYKGVIQSYGEAMANYQSEKMYSEEEVIKIVEKSREIGLTAEYLLLTEQFKKK